MTMPDTPSAEPPQDSPSAEPPQDSPPAEPPQDSPPAEPPQDSPPAEPPQDSPPAEPPNSVSPPPESGGGILGFVKAHMMITAIVGVAAVAIVVVIVVFSTGLVGSGGGGGGGGRPADYILKDSTFVAVVNVAAILDSVEIPAQLWDLGDSDHDDPEEWKDRWREGFSDDLYIPRMIRDDITLDDIQYGVFQEDADGSDLEWLFIGSFSFEDIRDALEDEDLEDGKYRDFEVWDDRDIALLEDQGAIISDQSLVEDVLKALDTGRGSISQGEPAALKRALDKAGDGLVIRGTTNCESGGFFFRTSLRGCAAAVVVVKGGDADTTEVTGVYVFGNERRAESGMEDLEEAIESQDAYDADLEAIETDGDLVTYKVIIHEQ